MSDDSKSDNGMGDIGLGNLSLTDTSYSDDNPNSDTSSEASLSKEEDTKPERDYSHFFSKPMFEVFHISIHPKEEDTPFLHQNPCQIYGTVGVVDEDGKRFEFYNRTETDPETIIPGNNISLSAFPMIPSKLLQVVVNLYDGSHNVEIANGCFEIDYSNMYDYDKVDIKHIEGEYGCASVCFATFQHAVIASLDKVELRSEASRSGFSDYLLFGKVVAHLNRKFGKADGNVDDEFPAVTLFHNQQAELNTPIKLLRSCVVVPFYCSLAIEADFNNKTDTRVNMAIQLNVYPERLNKESVEANNYEMRIKVNWLNCYCHFPQEVKEPEEEEESVKLSSKAQQSSSRISRQCFSKVDLGKPRVSEPMLPSFAEVFSVLICAPDDLVMSGNVEIVDCLGSFDIFKAEQQRCCGHKSLPILGLPHTITPDFFCVKVNINDEEERVVSEGFFQWTNLNDNSFYRDKRICSVIMGDIGYAAVHYSMFEYSLKATTRVSFLSKTIPGAHVKVAGSIRAEYGKIEYSTPYDQEYYKSTLFSSDEYVQVGLVLGSTLPLLKPVIPVPFGNSLILDLNLRVTGPCDEEVEVINKAVEFKTDADGYFVYKGSDYIISVCVEWCVDTMKETTSRPILPHKTWLQKVLQKASTTA